MTAGAGLRDALTSALRAALSARDQPAVGALRSALAAISNAEAVDASPSRPPAGRSEHVAGASAGLGAADVPRRVLTESEVREIVLAEIAEREAAARQYAAHGHARRGSQLEAEAVVLQSALDQAGG